MNLTHSLQSVVGAAAGIVTLVYGAPANAALTWVETQGTFAPGNLATQPGAVAFAFDVFWGGGYLLHQIDHLNDGIYGNDNSWIGASGDSFAGISFASGTTVNQIAWGSEHYGAFGDRYQGTYTVQYTTQANPTKDTPAEAWTDIGSVTYDTYPIDNIYRHLYEFSPVYATGLRITTHSTALDIRIDEIEVYGAPVPESSTFLAGICTLGICGVSVWRNRKSTGG